MARISSADKASTLNGSSSSMAQASDRVRDVAVVCQCVGVECGAVVFVDAVQFEEDAFVGGRGLDAECTVASAATYDPA
jgi:hypothetical protein